MNIEAMERLGQGEPYTVGDLSEEFGVSRMSVLRAMHEGDIEPIRRIGLTLCFSMKQRRKLYTTVCERQDRRFCRRFQRWLTLNERYCFTMVAVDRNLDPFPKGSLEHKAAGVAQRQMKRIALKRRDAEFREMFKVDFGLGEKPVYDERFWRKALGVTFDPDHTANRGKK